MLRLHILRIISRLSCAAIIMPKGTKKKLKHQPTITQLFNRQRGVIPLQSTNQKSPSVQTTMADTGESMIYITSGKTTGHVTTGHVTTEVIDLCGDGDSQRSEKEADATVHQDSINSQEDLFDSQPHSSPPLLHFPPREILASSLHEVVGSSSSHETPVAPASTQAEADAPSATSDKGTYGTDQHVTGGTIEGKEASDSGEMDQSESPASVGQSESPASVGQSESQASVGQSESQISKEIGQSESPESTGQTERCEENMETDESILIGLFDGSQVNNIISQPDQSISAAVVESQVESENDRKFKPGSSQSRNEEPVSPSPEPVHKGTPITELVRCCHTTSQVPSLSSNHTVCFDVNTVGDTELRPHPSKFVDKWDDFHVKMPCSDYNEYYSGHNTAARHNTPAKRWPLICKSLQSEITSIRQLKDAILSYNLRFKDRWDLSSLEALIEDEYDYEKRCHFFQHLLPAMVDLALRLPQICTKPLPLLRQGRVHSITITQHQAACLLANAFFCTFPRRNSHGQRTDEYLNYPDINFIRLFGGSESDIDFRRTEKLKFILNYFQWVTTKMPQGSMTFTRQCIKDFKDWRQSSTRLTRLHVTSQGLIEDQGHGMLQVDFANKFVGGGVLGRGAVQEEIRFVMCPEMILSRLFTEVLDDNECLIMTGCETFSSYSGYADSIKWDGNYQDTSPRDAWGRRCCHVVAMDATAYKSNQSRLEQFDYNHVCREVNKAYCGFKCFHRAEDLPLPAVATGNWGCGAFGGNHHLKAVIQMMAASEAGRDVCYFTFGDTKLADDIAVIHGTLCEQDYTVGQTMALIGQYWDDISNDLSLTTNKKKKNLKMLKFKDFILSAIQRPKDGQLHMTPDSTSSHTTAVHMSSRVTPVDSTTQSDHQATAQEGEEETQL